jgi:hypothetical protein
MIPAMRLTFLRFGVLAASLVSLSSCFFFAPDEEVIVPLPVEGTYARIQVWGNTISDGRYEVVVASPLGSSRQKLWEDWGPAQRASLYWSLDGRLIVIGVVATPQCSLFLALLAHGGSPSTIGRGKVAKIGATLAQLTVMI